MHPDPDQCHFFKDNFRLFLSQLNEPFRNKKFYCLFCSKVQVWVLGVNFFLQFLVNILLLGSGSVDPHIFADPDPGSQHLTDPTDLIHLPD